VEYARRMAWGWEPRSSARACSGSRPQSVQPESAQPESSRAVTARTPDFGGPRSQPRLFFTSGGTTCLIGVDGTGLRKLDLDVPGQVTWQAGEMLRDGRLLLLSMEVRRDGPRRPFDAYYTLTPTHIWAYDLDAEMLEELAIADRIAPFYTPQLVLHGGRILVQVCRPGYGQIFTMNLDGTDARAFTSAEEGLPYGFSLSPDGQQVAFHLASPEGYQIWTCDAWGQDRVCVAADPEHLYFGPTWAPDGQWLLYQDCHHRADPGHDWSDLRMSRPDGSEHRLLTEGQAMWFGATYGGPGNRGGGSNVAAWTPDGQILFPRRRPGSKVAWEYQAGRPDTDHFNRDYKPELARGATEICRLDPASGVVTTLTSSVLPAWDFRASASADGCFIAFCRAETGGAPSLWAMDADGGAPRLLTRGLDERGADHPRWFSNR
jgi:hypothetical protein